MKENQEIIMVPLKKITSSFNHRDRAKEQDVSYLMASIKKDGLLQPIGVTKHKDMYKIIFGNRRYEAFKKLGLAEIPATLIEPQADKDFIALNLIENMARKDASFVEVGNAISIMINKHKMSAKEVGVRLNITAERVRAFLNAFDNVPDNLKNKISNAKGKGKRSEKSVPIHVASKIINLQKQNLIDTNTAAKLFQDVYDKKINTLHINEYTKRLKAGKKISAMKNVTPVSFAVMIDTAVWETAKKLHGVHSVHKIVEAKVKETIKELSV